MGNGARCDRPPTYHARRKLDDRRGVGVCELPFSRPVKDKMYLGRVLLGRR
jgi:hypothetical protein